VPLLTDATDASSDMAAIRSNSMFELIVVVWSDEMRLKKRTQSWKKAESSAAARPCGPSSLKSLNVQLDRSLMLR